MLARMFNIFEVVGYKWNDTASGRTEGEDDTCGHPSACTNLIARLSDCLKQKATYVSLGLLQNGYVFSVQIGLTWQI